MDFFSFFLSESPFSKNLSVPFFKNSVKSFLQILLLNFRNSGRFMFPGAEERCVSPEFTAERTGISHRFYLKLNVGRCNA